MCCKQQELSWDEKLSEVSKLAKLFGNKHVNSSSIWTGPFDKGVEYFDA